MFVPLGGICFLMALFVKDVGLPDDKPKEEEDASPVSMGDATSEDDPSPSRSDSETPHQLPISKKKNFDSTEKIRDAEDQKNT